MPTRAEQLANQFEQAVNDFAKTIEQIPDDRWLATGGPEGWTIAALAQHVSGQYPLEMEYLTAAAEGRPLPSYTWDDVNGMNGRRADANSNASKANVLRELRDNAANAAAFVRGLSDEQLDRASALPLAGGAEVATQQLIKGGVLIDHAREHMKSLQGAA
jgi:hypothetical protein